MSDNQSGENGGGDDSTRKLRKTASDTANCEPVVIAEFEKNARENVRVSLTEYRKVLLLDVRAFYRDGDVWKPGKGLSIRRDQIPALRKALQAAEKAAKDVDATAAA